ncbi:MAG: hypothetical protein K2Y21_00505 [Phycisphaerales bacterium]|nr:hypothetical protein [Phycisphaerales bacterium]
MNKAELGIAAGCVGAIAVLTWFWHGDGNTAASEKQALQAEARRLDGRRAALEMTDGVVDSKQVASIIGAGVQTVGAEIDKSMYESLRMTLAAQLVARTSSDATLAIRLAEEERGMRWLKPGDDPGWNWIIRTCTDLGIKTDDATDARVLFERYLAAQYAATRFRGIASSQSGARLILYRARTEDQCYDLMMSGLSDADRAFWFSMGKTQLGLCFRIPVRTLASMLEAEGAVWVASSQTFVRQANGTVGQFHCVLVWDSQAKSWVPIQVSRRGEGSIVWY